jgi:hypothetical protein
VTSIRQIATASVSSTRSTLNPSDLKTAAKLKEGINEQLSRVRLGQPLPEAKMPQQGRDGVWHAPSGDRLFSVSLSKPPPGSADFPTTYALVNPRTNEFFKMQSGGFTGATFAHGPLALPNPLHFKTRSLGPVDFKKLEAAANHEGSKPRVPTRSTIDAALGAYMFHGMLKFGSKAPADSTILTRVSLRKDPFPDGYAYSGLVLKSDPNKVIIQRSGGLANLTTWSQAIDVSRIPK